MYSCHRIIHILWDWNWIKYSTHNMTLKYNKTSSQIKSQINIPRCSKNGCVLAVHERNRISHKHSKDVQNNLQYHCQKKTPPFLWCPPLYSTRTSMRVRYDIRHKLTNFTLLEKLPLVQPVKRFVASFGTRKFITVFTRTLHWSIGLSWARSIQSIPPHSISITSILPTYVVIILWSLSFWFSHQYPICTPLRPVRATHAQPIWSSLITWL
jgi:hypothetical protein